MWSLIFICVENKQQDKTGTATLLSCLCEVAETTDCAAHCGGGRSGYCPRTTRNDFLTSRARPNADSLALHAVLAAEGAGVPCVLSNFHLFDLLSQGSTVTRAVLASDADLACAFCHCSWP